MRQKSRGVPSEELLGAFNKVTCVMKHDTSPRHCTSERAFSGVGKMMFIFHRNYCNEKADG